MLISLCMANFGIIPFNSSICESTLIHDLPNLSTRTYYSLPSSLYHVMLTDHMVNKYLVPLAVPLFLFDSDLKRVVRDAGSLLIAFLIGALSTVVGTLVAFPLIPLKTLGENGWKVACALTARHIGGAINL